MPVRNGERYLREAIDSILTQTWPDFELIIIDDYSTDQTAEIVRGYDDDRLVFELNSMQLGPARSRNRGLSLAKGEYVACMDADDIALPQRLELQVDFLKRNPHIALVGAAATTIDSHGIPVETTYQPNDAESIRGKLLSSNCFVQSTIMMKTAAVRGLGGYRFPLAEDYDLWLRMSEHYDLANLSEPLVLFRTHSHQTSIQQREELALWGIAARYSARIRHNSGCDPMSGVERVTPTLLCELGVDETEIQNALADSFLIRLNLLLKTDQRRGLEDIKKAYDLLRSESITRNLKKSIAMRILGVAHHCYSHKQYGRSRALLKLCIRIDAGLLVNDKAIRLAIKLALGERSTDVIRGLKRIFVPTESSAASKSLRVK